MSMGLVSDDLFQQELDRLSGQSPMKNEHRKAQIIDKPSKGRSNGDNNVPESLRKIIGETAVIDGRQEAVRLANQFGISASSVSAYAKGATSTTSYNEPKPSIIDHINKSRRRAISRASKTLNQSLASITQDKLDYSDAKDLAQIARSMSGIIKDLEPPASSSEINQSNNTQFVIFAPSFRKEEAYESIIVKE